jgi:hypothetical protein
MKRLPNNSTRCTLAFAVLVLWACSSDDNMGGAMTAPTAGMPSAAGATGSAGTTSGTGAAGSSRNTSGGAGAAAAGTSGGAGAGVTAGSSGTTSGGAGAAGMTPATAGTAGTATAGAAPTSGAGGAGGTPSTSSRPLSSTLKLPTMVEKKAVAPFFNIWRPMDLTKVEGKLPIFVWNNGACSRNDAVFKALFEKWASGGYFVLSLTSGGGSSSTTIADQKALIDWVVAEAGMASSPYKDKLDIDKISAGGNSCGGITSLGLASMDPRVKSIFVLSGSSGFGGADTTVTNGIKVPVAYLVGGEEDIARANAESDYEAFAAGFPAMMVKRSSGDHLMISNNQEVMVDAADISVNWLDLTMFGLQGALDALNTPTVCTGCESGLWTLTSKNLETLVK